MAALLFQIMECSRRLFIMAFIPLHTFGNYCGTNDDFSNID